MPTTIMHSKPIFYAVLIHLRRGLHGLVAMLVSSLAALCVPAAVAVDWQAVPQQELTLFHPGQVSWEWLLTPADHPGASGIRGGSTCRTCHEGQQADIGTSLAKADGAVTNPPPASLTLRVQTAWDQKRFYLRASWPVRGTADKSSRFTMMFDDGQVTEATRAGCWGACHDDLKGMPSAASSDVRSKYLVASRSKVTRQGGGDNLKSPAELAALRAQGKFLEYWQARISTGAPPQVLDGYILEQRHVNPQSALDVQAKQEGGRWIVELSRPLVMDTPGRKTFSIGTTYTLGFAVHESDDAGRSHYVSFGYSLKLAPGSADLTATRME